MTDGAAASPAAVLRALVARAVDADPADVDDRSEVVDRTSKTESGARDAEDSSTPAGRLAELVGAAESVVAVVPRFDAELARRLDASLAAAADDEATGAERDAGPDASAPRTIRIVFTDAASRRLTGAAGAVVRRALADRGVDAYRHDGESPVAVVLADDRALVGLVDDGGVAALLWTDDPPVREWAAATCRRYLDVAEPVDGG